MTAQTGVETRQGAVAAQAMILVTMLLWGSQVPVLYALAPRWDPFTLNLLRYLFGLTVFALLLRLLEPRRAVLRRVPAGRIVILGVLMASFGLLYTASAMIGDPVAVSTVAAVMPLTASLVTWAALGKRPDRRHVVALTIILPAGALVTPVGGATGDHPVLGVVLMLCAQTAWSLYSLMAQSWLPGYSQLRRTALSVAASIPWHVLAFALAAALGATVEPAWPLHAPDLALILYVTLGPLVIGVVLWNASVARLGLPAVALYLNLIPVVGILGTALLGVWPGPLQIVGATVMIVAMAIFRPRPRLEPDVVKPVAGGLG